MYSLSDTPISINVKYIKQNNFDNVLDMADALMFLRSLNTQSFKISVFTKLKAKRECEKNPNIVNETLAEMGVKTIYDAIINTGHTDIIIVQGTEKTIALSYNDYMYLNFDEPAVQEELSKRPDGAVKKVPLTEL